MLLINKIIKRKTKIRDIINNNKYIHNIIIIQIFLINQVYNIKKIFPISKESTTTFKIN